LQPLDPSWQKGPPPRPGHAQAQSPKGRDHIPLIEPVTRILSANLPLILPDAQLPIPRLDREPFETPLPQLTGMPIQIAPELIPDLVREMLKLFRPWW
jgi:hypothetical protein